jgi:hypothetical protein
MSYSPISPEPSRWPRWAGVDGLPTAYVARAALHAASLIDVEGSLVSQARESYWHKASGGEFSAASIAVGEQLLLDTGLLVERDGRLHLTRPLEEILDGSIEDALFALALEASSLPRGPADPQPPEGLEDLVPDPERREELLLSRAQRFDDLQRRLVGEIGEELVLAVARKELNELNRGDLARRVRRVSLESDALGYDISAPRLIGRPRMLEVKATTRAEDPLRIHISRNEARTGARYPEWSLVVCHVDDVEARTGELQGWCAATTFSIRLPRDPDGGRWEQAEVEIRPVELMPDLPPATL